MIFPLRLFTKLAICLTLAACVSSASGQSFDKRSQNSRGSNATTPKAASPQPAFHLPNLRFGPLSGTPEDMARTYLRAKWQSLRLKADLSDLLVSQVQESPAGHHVRFYQTYDGIPVHQADVVVSIDKQNCVEFLTSNYKAELSVPTTVPQIAADAAIQITRRYLGVSGSLHGEQQARLMVKVDGAKARLVYRVVIPAFEPRGDWEVFVDAITGDVIEANDMTCFHKEPKDIKPRTQVFPKLLPTLTVRPAIQELAGQVSAAKVTDNMRRLEAFQTRYVQSAAGRDSLARSRDWIIAQLQSYGYTDIVQSSFTYNSYTLQNIVATKQGSRAPDTMVVLGGHYDTVNGPGTDDNGSGASLVLETARVLAKTNFEYTVKYIFFSAEEQGLVGSQAYVQNVAVPGNHKIRVMINADMIGYSGGGNVVKVEKDFSTPSGNNAASALYTDTLAALTQLYSTLTTQITNAYGSDYMSFQDAGYVITGFFEGINNPNYHTTRDSLRYVDTNYVTQITKGAVAGISHFAKITSGSGLVFDPDPLTTGHATYGDPGYSDNNDADTPELTAQRQLRALRDITLSSGLYRLTGPYVNCLDWDTPNTPVVTAANPDSFRFTRYQDGFEDVMVYYWLDNSQRHIQELGFTNIQNTSIGADPHGFQGADNSAYYPSTNRLTFGEGGVDDAEDADVILHEYGHAIHHGTVPGWSGSGQQGSLGEGFGDYWAESYSRSRGLWQPTEPPYFWVFDWDGHNPFWAGRVLNYSAHYPEGLTGTIHTDGQMWSSTLMSIWNEIGVDVLDRLVLQSHFYLASSGVTMTQNADAVIQADRNLYGGTHVPTLVYWFGQRGFINPASYIPQITHTPLSDSENPSGPYSVLATIVAGGSPLNLSKLKTYWGRTGVFTDSITMTTTGNPNEYRALIPGNGQPATYRYYISATDNANATATHPSNAPTSYHTFRVGPDTIAPTITHTPLRDQARIRWPATVLATVTDNIGVDSVWVEFIRQRGNLTGNFGLQKTAGSDYQGVFSLDTNQVVVGDSIYYGIAARDRVIPPNIRYSPSTGYHKFAITATRGVILVVDDDITTKTDEASSDKGADERPPAEKGIASRLIVRTLSGIGFIVDTASFAVHNTSVYSNYDIVVWSAGSKTSSMFNDAAKRAALIARVNAGGKVWIEGGEVGYIYRKSGSSTDLDPPFRRTVLRDSLWLSDVTSANLVITQPSHRLFTTPHAISSPIPLPSSGVYHRDAMRLMPGDSYARKLAGWSTYANQGPDTAGLIVYNPSGDPNVGTSVIQLFSVGAVTDTVVAKKLIENTAEFLMTRSGSPTIAVQPSSLDYGRIQLGDSSVQFVRVQNAGTAALTVTNITNASTRYTVTPKIFTLNSQDTTRLRVVFRPVAAGTVSDTLRFASNASSPPAIPLTGRGGIPFIVVQPDSFAFVLPPSGDTTRAQLVIRNTGTDTLTYSIDEAQGALSPSVGRSMEQQEVAELKKVEADPGSGEAPTKASGGPDAAGYLWFDSDETNGPQFSWLDIRSVGTALTLTDDQNVGPFTLGFNFSFYGNTYDAIRICSNGWVSFTSTSNEYSNSAIPTSSEPSNALYGFWDDLDPGTGGTVHYYADATNQRFIVQYTDVPHYSTTGPGTYTFELIVKANGDILYQYLDMRETLNSATIGIENSTGSIALQVVFNATYVRNNLAILFTKDAVPWLSTDRLAGIIAPGQNQSVEVRVHPSGAPVSLYEARLIVANNAQETKRLPVLLSLTNEMVVSVGVTAGWNLISNPVTRSAGTDSVRHIFPSSVFPHVYAYTAAGYELYYTMANGRGYWEKFPTATSTNITGGPRTRDSISVVAGWNVVGSISYAVDTATIVSVPPNIRASQWYGFAGTYAPSGQIVPGKAYWVKANAAGRFVLASQTALAAKHQNDGEPLESRMNTLTITDAEGNAQTLLFGPKEALDSPVDMFEMPPLPPEGSFDVRFETEDGGYMLQVHETASKQKEQFTVAVQAIAYPLTVHWKIDDVKSSAYALSYVADGKSLSTPLLKEGKLLIENPRVNRIALGVSSAAQLPTEYALSQNYPNPFNPSATITYALPVASMVTLKVYDVLGREVRVLVDEIQNAGFRWAAWDAMNNVGFAAASGVYFYRLTAASAADARRIFTQAKKMLLVR